MPKTPNTNNFINDLSGGLSFYAKLIADYTHEPAILFKKLLHELHNNPKLQANDKVSILSALDLLDKNDSEVLCKELIFLASNSQPQDMDFIGRIIIHSLNSEKNNILQALVKDEQTKRMIVEALRAGAVLQHDVIQKAYSDYEHFLRELRLSQGNNAQAEKFSDMELHNDEPKAPDNNEASAVLLGVVGAFVIGYETSANNALIRNAYSEYLNKIQSVSVEQLLEIRQNYQDPQEQIKQVKLLARNKLATQMYNNTLYSGATGTLVLSAALGFLIGPFALIPVGIGSIITLFMADRNKKLLLSRIDKAIEQEHGIDLAINKKFKILNETDHLKSIDHTEKHVRKLVLGNIFSVMTLRVLVLAQFGVASVSPILFGVLAGMRTLINWREANKRLNSMYTHPERSLRAALHNQIESTSMTSNYYSRNEFKKYLLENMEEVDGLIAQHGLQNKRLPGILESITRKIMSGLGLWENEKFNKVLETLYFPDYKNHIVLEHLRHNCLHESFDKKLDKYFEKNRKKLGLEFETLDELKAHPKVNEYNRLLRSYLNETASNNAGNVVKMTGFGTLVTASIMVLSVGMLFSPAAPVAIATASLIVAGYAATKLAEYYYRTKMRKIVEKVEDEKISDIFSSKLHMRKNLKLEADEAKEANVVKDDLKEEKSLPKNNPHPFIFRNHNPNESKQNKLDLNHKPKNNRAL